jgi:hypothetical protein
MTTFRYHVATSEAMASELTGLHQGDDGETVEIDGGYARLGVRELALVDGDMGFGLLQAKLGTRSCAAELCEFAVRHVVSRPWDSAARILTSIKGVWLDSQPQHSGC